MENLGKNLNASPKNPPLRLEGGDEKHLGAIKEKFPQGWPNPTWESQELLDTTHLEGLPMSHPEFEGLREWWREKFEDIMVPAPLDMPPLREVHHPIPLKDPEKKFRETTPRCPAALQEALAIKIDCYVDAGWWFPATSE